MGKMIRVLAMMGVGVAALIMIHSPVVWSASMRLPLWLRLAMTAGVVIAVGQAGETLRKDAEGS